MPNPSPAIPLDPPAPSDPLLDQRVRHSVSAPDHTPPDDGSLAGGDERVKDVQDALIHREEEDGVDGTVGLAAYGSMSSPMLSFPPPLPSPPMPHYNHLARRGSSSPVAAAVGVVCGFLGFIGIFVGIFFYVRRPKRVRVRRARRRRQSLDLVEEMPAEADAEADGLAGLPSPRTPARSKTTSTRSFLQKMSFDGGRVAMHKIISPSSTEPPKELMSPTATSAGLPERVESLPSSEGRPLERSASFWRMFARGRRPGSGDTTHSGTALRAPVGYADADANAPAPPSATDSTSPYGTPDPGQSTHSLPARPQQQRRQGQGRRHTSPTPTDRHEVDVDMASEAGFSAAEHHDHDHAALPHAQQQQQQQRQQRRPSTAPDSAPRSSSRTRQRRRRSPSAADMPSYPPNQRDGSSIPRRQTMLPSYDASADAEPAPESMSESGTAVRLPPAYSPPHPASPLASLSAATGADESGDGEMLFSPLTPAQSRPDTPTSSRGRPLPRLPPPGR